MRIFIVAFANYLFGCLIGFVVADKDDLIKSGRYFELDRKIYQCKQVEIKGEG